MVRDFQSRLSMKHDIIKRKVLDNQISLAGNPTDCIRIHVEKNDEGDKLSTIVKQADVISVVWPSLKDVPIRKIHKNNPDGYVNESIGNYTITSLVNIAGEGQNEQMFKLFFPHGADLNVDDLIVRVFIDPDVDYPIVIVVKVAEILGTFGQMMLISQSATCTLDAEDMPKELQNIIGEMAERRLHLQF